MVLCMLYGGRMFPEVDKFMTVFICGRNIHMPLTDI